MQPPDPYDQSGQPGATEHFKGAQSPYPYRGPQANTPLPLPYDDYDPTYQTPPPPPNPPPSPPPVPHPQHPRRGRGGQVPAPPPVYVQPPPQPQIIYVRERRPSWFSLSCRVLAIVMLMACGLIGLAVYRLGSTALETWPARLAVISFCNSEQSQNYQSAYGDLSSQLQQQVSAGDFQQTSELLDQEHGDITNCARADTSPDTVNDNTVTIALDISRGSIYYTGNVVLVQQGGSWRINQIDTSLDLG